MVITLGSPSAAPATNVVSRWRLIAGENLMAQSAEKLRCLAEPMPMPITTTSTYSRCDGVVAWQVCRASGPLSENVQVRGYNILFVFNPAAFSVIADRLAQPPSRRAPFRPSALVAPFFPRADRVG